MAKSSRKSKRSNGRPTPRATPGGDGADSRRRGADLVREQRSRERRRNVMVQVGVVVGVVLVVLLVTVAVLRAQDANAPAAAPPQVDDEGSFVVGQADAPVSVTVVEDYLCPFCQRLEADAGDLLEGYSEGEDVSVAYRGIAILDRASNDDYSSRALAASACVMAEGQEVWKDFHRTLYEQQPSEGGAGLSDDELVEIATQAGASEEVAACVSEGSYRDWAEQVTRATIDSGVSSTPTVMVDGEEVESPSASTIAQAVEAAQETQGSGGS